MKVMIITNIPNPYRIPLFNLLDKELDKEGVELVVIFGARSYIRRQFTLKLEDCKFRYEILESRKVSFLNKEKTIFTYKGIRRSVKRYQPDKIIVVGFSIATFWLFLRSFFIKTSYIIWSGSILTKGRQHRLPRLLYRRAILNRAEGFLVYGSRAKQYLVRLGAPEDKIYTAINTVDTDFFSEQVKILKRKRIVNFTKHLLCVGYLVKGKKIELLFDMIKILSKFRSNFILQIVGDGPSVGNLHKLAVEKDVADLIEFTGFIQKEHLPSWYANADCFLFPSEYDVWGLVLNEAMAAGLPCIASIHAGATQDLIVDGVTGFAADFSDPENIAVLVDRLLTDRDLAARIGLEAQKVIQEKVKLIHTVKGFKQVLHLC